MRRKQKAAPNCFGAGIIEFSRGTTQIEAPRFRGSSLVHIPAICGARITGAHPVGAYRQSMTAFPSVNLLRSVRPRKSIRGESPAAISPPAALLKDFLLRYFSSSTVLYPYYTRCRAICQPRNAIIFKKSLDERPIICYHSYHKGNRKRKSPGGTVRERSTKAPFSVAGRL